jgi:EAL domain-containing protein (putative c-di-GMP-specific phosphodiesterase class I)
MRKGGTVQRHTMAWNPTDALSSPMSSYDNLALPEEMRGQVQGRLTTVHALRNAVVDNELVLHYQPIVGLYDRRLLGVEALVRWNRPRFGLVKPEEFISIAEQAGLIAEIDSWVIETACRQAASWHGAVPIAVNLSAQDLRRPDTAGTVSAALRRTGLPPGTLTLEIGERTLASGDATIEANAAAISALGVRFAIDHLGADHSSFASLQQLPAQLLKIDQSLVSTLDEDEACPGIVRAIVEMGHALGLAVIAEGVQRHGQVDRLRALGCDGAQGRLFARPQPAADLGRGLAAGAINAPRVAFWSVERVPPEPS